MKKLISLILIVSMCLALLSGCKDNDSIVLDDGVIREAIIADFMKLAEIPRESGHMKAISTYLRTWAKENGFKVIRDKFNNVIINEPASKGYEDAPVIILQCHMDMTAVATEGVVFNPENDSIRVLDDEKKLKGQGTSLGADNGIGIATAMYILKNADNHGPIRVIFTTNEETNMSGAKNIDPKHLEGEYLISLDWNDDTSICYGSAETYTYKMTKDIAWTSPQNAIAYEISVKNLKGGDAGLNINDGGANAIKLIGETLAQAQSEGVLFELASFNGGIVKNRIPSEATAVVILNDIDVKKIQKVFKSQKSALKKDHGKIEKNYEFTLKEAVMPEKVLSAEDSNSIIAFIYGVLDGVQIMSAEDENTVESSSNIGVVSTSSGDFVGEVYTISSSKEMAQGINNAHQAVANLSGMQVSFLESAPGWITNPEGALPSAFADIYSEIYEEDIKMKIMHDESECGWFAQKNSKLEIVSVGPLIKNSDTPKEAVYLDTISKPAVLILKFIRYAKY